MSALLAVKIMEAIGQKNIPLTLSYATHDATANGGILPQEIPLVAALQVMGGLYGGISDFNVVIQNIEEQGNTVAVEFQWGGTHDGALNLTPAGLPMIPPTGKPIWVDDLFIFTFTGNKISAVKVDSPIGGGIPGALAQVNVVPA